MPSNTERCVVWQVRFHHRQVFGSTSMCIALHQCASLLYVSTEINLSIVTLLIQVFAAVLAMRIVTWFGIDISCFDVL